MCEFKHYPTQFDTKTLFVVVSCATVPAALLQSNAESAGLRWLIASFVSAVLSFLLGLQSKLGPGKTLALFGTYWAIVWSVSRFVVTDPQPWESPTEWFEANVYNGCVLMLVSMPTFGLVGTIGGWIATACFGVKKVWGGPRLSTEWLAARWEDRTRSPDD
jgi:hypothetical protein